MLNGIRCGCFASGEFQSKDSVVDERYQYYNILGEREEGRGEREE